MASNLWGKEAQLALYVLVDVVFLTGEAPHPAAKLRFDSLVHAHLLCSAQQAEGGEREWMSSRVKPVCRGRIAAVWQIGTLQVSAQQSITRTHAAVQESYFSNVVVMKKACVWVCLCCRTWMLTCGIPTRIWFRSHSRVWSSIVSGERNDSIILTTECEHEH